MRVLIIGGSGRLGQVVVPALLDRNVDVQVLSRDPGRARPSVDGRAEVVLGDVRNAASIATAVAGRDVVVAAAHGLTGGRTNTPKSVDRDGVANIAAARLTYRPMTSAVRSLASRRRTARSNAPCGRPPINSIAQVVVIIFGLVNSLAGTNTAAIVHSKAIDGKPGSTVNRETGGTFPCRPITLALLDTSGRGMLIIA